MICLAKEYARRRTHALIQVNDDRIAKDLNSVFCPDRTALDGRDHADYISGMQIKSLSPNYGVAAQISPEDVADLTAQGITTVICNRPDMENPVELQAGVLRAAVEAAGLTFHENPVFGGSLSLEDVDAQAALVAASDGKVLAYCASGTRSAILWAFAMAGHLPTDAILDATSAAGYEFAGMCGQIDALAARQ